MDDNKLLATDVVAELKKQGAEACDVYISLSSSSKVNIRMGRIEKLAQSINKGLGMRVFKNNATAITYTTDFTEKTIKSLIKEAMEIVTVSNADECNGLVPIELLGACDEQLKIFDESIAQISPEEKINRVKEAEDVGLTYDKRITNSQGASWTDDISQITLANSNGFLGQYQTSAASLSVSLLAEHLGVKQRDYWYSFSRFANTLISPKDVGEQAAQRTLRKLGGKKVKSQIVPVVVDPFVSRRLLGFLFNAANGSNIYRKSSYLVDKINQQVISPLITIVDDSTIISGPASRPFDGEGVKSARLVIFDKGVLKNYVCDSYSACRLKRKPTGNTSRNYKSHPSVSATNLYIKAGETTALDIVKSIKNGLYLTDLFPQGYNSITGHLSQGVSGFWIENGEITYPVQEITLAGNLLSMFSKITMVGDDLSFKLGGTVAPTILISEATVGGF
ncbi:MAG: PmbA protein [bacterium]|nr:MAG: PmbA protein [bacterium]